jgi:phosphopantothenoylcysteine synthetase/decarboxylase
MANKKKTVALAVTGSIAAYKAADLCSQMVKKGLDVTVIMTESAQKLICAQTFLTLSKNQVVTDLWDIPDWRPGHIELAERAELLVVAPCTANFIGKFANGIADDALSTYALSHSGKVLLAPAMNPKMWANPIVKANCEKLKGFKVEFVGPASGPVACGADGEGRMSEVKEIMNKLLSLI